MLGIGGLGGVLARGSHVTARARAVGHSGGGHGGSRLRRSSERASQGRCDAGGRTHGGGAGPCGRWPLPMGGNNTWEQGEGGGKGEKVGLGLGGIQR